MFREYNVEPGISQRLTIPTSRLLPRLRERQGPHGGSLDKRPSGHGPSAHKPPAPHEAVPGGEGASQPWGSGPRLFSQGLYEAATALNSMVL